MSVERSGAREQHLLAQIAALKRNLLSLSKQNAGLSAALNREKDAHDFYKHRFIQCQMHCKELDWECQQRYWNAQQLYRDNVEMKRYINKRCSTRLHKPAGSCPNKRASKRRSHLKKKYRDFGRRMRIVSLETIEETDEPPQFNSSSSNLSQPICSSSIPPASDQADAAVDKKIVTDLPRPEYVVITMPDDDDLDVTLKDKNLQTTFDDDGYSSSSSNSSCRDEMLGDQVKDITHNNVSRESYWRSIHKLVGFPF